MKRKAIITVCISAALIAASAIALAGCGRKGKQAAITETGSTETASETVESAPAESEADEDYVQAEPYRKSRSDEKIIPERLEISDENGKLVMIQEFNADSRNMVIGEYGEIGLYPEEVYLVTNDGEVLIERYTYEYNDDGMVTTEACYQNPDPFSDDSSERLTSVTEYTYYDGRLSREDYYVCEDSGARTLTTTTEWEYDSNGFPVKKNIYNGSLLAYYEDITCNTNGKPVEMRQYTYDNVLTGIREYTYTEAGEYLTYKEYVGDHNYLAVDTQYVYDSRDYLREVNVTYYDYTDDEENDGPTVTEEHYNYIYPEEDQNKLGTLE